MTAPDDPNKPLGPEDDAQPGESAELEDAYDPEEHPNGTNLDEDTEMLDSTVRTLDAESEEPEAGEVVRSPIAARALEPEAEDAGDADSIVDESDEAGADESSASPNWDTQLSARRIAVELKRLEAEIRETLEGRDSKRKRKLTGSRRWAELEEDILAWRFAGRFEEETLDHLRRLVTRRHHLFRRLRFLAGTRPVWNT